jgi:Neuraminidase (sialidase)
MIKLLALSLVLFTVSILGVRAFAQKEAALNIKKEIVLSLLPGNNNPRNSEGDFITLKNGRILYIYSHFIGESGSDYGHAYLASRYSTDEGKTWSKTDHIVVSQKGGMNVMSVSLLRLHNGNIALFYAKKQSKTDCMPMMRISTDEAKTWSKPIACITNRKGYFVLNNNRVIQLKNGRLIMAVARHETPKDPTWHDEGTLFSYYSDNNGTTWKSGEQVPNPNNIVTQEPGLVQLKNGNIFMFIRTNAGVQYASYSSDSGEIWSPIQPTDIVSPLSPASIARIPSRGDLLMVWNDNGKNQKRTPLNTAISHDEGKTWDHIKTLEDDPNGTFCYTAIHFVGKYVLLAYSNWATMGTTIVRLKIKDLYK